MIDGLVDWFSLLFYLATTLVATLLEPFAMVDPLISAISPGKETASMCARAALSERLYNYIVKFNKRARRPSCYTSNP